MNNTPTEIQDILLEAMSIIANSAVQEGTSNQDVTLWTCIITEDSNRNIGEYKVTDGNVSFLAYSANTDYKVDDHVAVVIPQGSFENTKYIVQKVAADGSYLPYATPLDSYIKMGENLAKYNNDGLATVNVSTGDISPISLTKAEIEKQILRIPINDSFNGQTNEKKAIFDSLILEGSFQSAMPEKTTGNYGIKLTLTYTNELGASSTEILKFDSSEFMGNPYDFVESTIQKKAFALSAGEALTYIIVTLYQNLNIVEGNNNSAALPLVTLNSFNLHFGNNITRNQDDTVEIYTVDSLSYYGDKDLGAAENAKKVGLLWHNKIGDNEYVGFSDGEFDLSYSEETYLTQKETNGQYEAEKLKPGAPTKSNALSLAVDLTKIENYFKNVYKEIDKLMATAATINNSIGTVLSKIDIKVVDSNNQEITVNAKTFLEQISDKSKIDTTGYLAYYYDTLYTEVENFLKKYREKLTSTETIDASSDVTALKNQFTSIDSYLTLDKTFTDFYVIGEYVRNTIQKQYGGFFSSYDSYNSQIKKYRSKILNEFVKINSILTPTDVTTSFANRYNSRNAGNDYVSTFDEDDYDNKYCIYWYKYSEDSEDSIGGVNWERITNFDNYGIPTIQGESVENIVYNKTMELASLATIKTYNADPQASIQQLKAILFFNHQKYESNILKFQRTTTDGSMTNNNGTLTIIHKTNSKDSYQVYDHNYSIIDSSDAKKERLLQPSFSGYMGQTLNDFNGGQIYWYLPINGTMLRYKADSDIIQTYGITPSSEGDNEVATVEESAEIANPHEKEGYYCFTKAITAEIPEGGTAEDAEVDPEKLQFSYQIADYYSSTYNNNTIYCKLVKGVWEFEAAITLLFSSFGSNGTDYTLSIVPIAGARSAVTKNEACALGIHLYDYTNKEIPIYADAQSHSDDVYGYNTIFSWVGPTTANKPPEASDVALLADSSEIPPNNYPNIIGSNTFLGLICTIDSPYKNTETEEIWCDILKVQTTIRSKKNTGDNGTKLIGFYCVPYSISSNPNEGENKRDRDYMTGATAVTYSSLGTNPEYYKDPYKLFDRSNNELNVSWEILYPNSSGYPQLDDNNKLIPQSSYIPDDGSAARLSFPIAHGFNEEKNIHWYQPIYISQDGYEYSVLNEFSGATEINAKEGKITTTMFIAGSKDSDGKFNGVLMGDIQNTTARATLTKTGLTGFSQGVSAFGFYSDGTAFIGKSGSGKLEFNGDKGTITSAGYAGGTGIYLDLDGPEFSIKKGDKNIMKVDYTGSKNEFYLQTENFDNDKETGLQISLSGKSIKAYEGLLIKTDKDNYIELDKVNNKIVIKTKDFWAGSTTGYISVNASGASIQAATFDLAAGSGSNRLILNSTPAENTDYHLNIGNKITYTKGGTLSLTPTIFKLDAGTTSLPFVLDSSPTNDADYHLNIGNKITYTKGGVLTLSPTTFVLSGGENSSINLGGFSANKDGFSLGVATNGITGTASGISITTTNFTAGSGNNYISVTSSGATINATTFNLISDNLEVTNSSFRIGSTTGTNISGSDNGITFNFASGDTLNFSSDDGLIFGEMIAINDTTQVLQSSDFDENIQGMKIDLRAGTIDAYSGLTIQSGTDNYIKLTEDTIEIKTNNFDLESGDLIISNTNGIEYGDIFKLTTNGELIVQPNNFVLSTSQDDNNKIIINNTLESNPLQFGNKFTVDWDGTVNAAAIKIQTDLYDDAAILFHHKIETTNVFLKMFPTWAQVQLQDYDSSSLLGVSHFIGISNGFFYGPLITRDIYIGASNSEGATHNLYVSKILPRFTDLKTITLGATDSTIRVPGTLQNSQIPIKELVSQVEEMVYKPANNRAFKVLGSLWYNDQNTYNLSEEKRVDGQLVEPEYFSAQNANFTIGLKKQAWENRKPQGFLKHGSIEFSSDGDIYFTQFIVRSSQSANIQYKRIKLSDLITVLGDKAETITVSKSDALEEAMMTVLEE